MNANLTGKAVTKDGKSRLVRREIAVPAPLDGRDVGKKPVVDYRKLKVGTAYRASGEIPIAPEIEPADPITAAAKIRHLPAKANFIVLEVATRRSTPWYRVRTKIGEGWINGVALIEKEVVAALPESKSE